MYFRDLRHWYAGIADYIDIVESSGAVVGRPTGADAVTAGHDLVMRFYEKGRKEVVIEREMNILTCEEATENAEECTQAMRDEL